MRAHYLRCAAVGSRIQTTILFEEPLHMFSKYTSRFLVPVVLAGLAAFTATPSANAGLVLVISDGIAADTTVLTDGGTGFIAVNATVGNFRVGGFAAAQGISPTVLSQTQNTVNITGTGPGTLTITEIQTGVTFTPTASAITLNSVIQASQITRGTYSFQSWLDGSNGNPLSGGPGSWVLAAPTGVTWGAQGPYTTVTSTNPPNTDVSVAISQPGPTSFTLVNQLSYSVTSAGGILSDTGTTNVYAAPEPASMFSALIGFGMLGLNKLRRRRSAQV
jgi:hypothetical protein